MATRLRPTVFARNQCQNRIYARQIAGQADFAAYGKPARSEKTENDSYKTDGMTTDALRPGQR